MAALEAKREDDWGRLGFGLYWIVNAMPNFSKTRRATIGPERFNPYLRKRRRKSNATTAAAFEALWNAAEDPR